MCRVGDDRRIGGEPLKRIARCRRQEDRSELRGVQCLGSDRHPGSLQEGHIKAHVVTDESRRAILVRKRDEESNRLSNRRRAAQILVTNARQPHDRWGERTARVCEREEALAEAHGSVGRDRQTDRADLDDVFGLRLVPGGFEVDRDEGPFQLDRRSSRPSGRCAVASRVSARAPLYRWHRPCGLAVGSARTRRPGADFLDRSSDRHRLARRARGKLRRPAR